MSIKNKLPLHNVIIIPTLYSRDFFFPYPSKAILLFIHPKKNQVCDYICILGSYIKPVQINPFKRLGYMFNRMRINVIVILIAVTVVFATVTSSYTEMIGKFYNTAKDYTCCKNDQLYAYHYYSIKFFWLKTAQGYTAEAIGKPTPGGCDIQCPNKLK